MKEDSQDRRSDTGTPKILRHPAVHEAIQESNRRCAERRRRVLRDPDLARELTLPPLDFPQPEMWNGFIPPVKLANGQFNQSERRKALMRIMRMAEVLDSEREAS